MTNLTHPWNISSQYCCCCCITLAMSDSVQPHRRQPTRLCRPWDSPGKNTGVGCHFLPQCMKVKSESEVAQSCPSLATPLTAAHQAPPSMGFSRQEYWSGVPLPSPLGYLKYSLIWTWFEFSKNASNSQKKFFFFFFNRWGGHYKGGK